MKKLISLFLLISCCLFPITAFGEEEITPASYSVQAVLPENQVNKKVDYFHLLMKPKENQTIKLNLFNQSEKKQTYVVAVNQATTNTNGNLVYDEPNKELDSSLKIPIEKVAKPKNTEITVNAKEKKVIEVEIESPEEPIEGILLGGIVVTLKGSNKEKKAGISIRNQLSYTTALMLTGNAETPVYGNVGLEIRKITPKIYNGKKAIEIQFGNSSSTILKDVTIEGKVLRKKRTIPIAKRKMDNIKIAPNSTVSFMIFEEDEHFSEGDYSFAGAISGKKIKGKNFTITKKMDRYMREKTNEVHFFSVKSISCFITIGLILSIFLIKIKKRRRRRVD